VEPTEGHPHFITGPVTLYEVATVRESLRTALADGDPPIRLDLGESGPWDIAGLQLLISCVRGGRLLGRDVRVAHVPGVCADLARRYGLEDWLRSVEE
jgi:ABC-type transporter Mla MlaB component